MSLSSYNLSIIAENFDVVRYSVFKERSPLSADIKPFQLPEQVLYSVQLFFFSTEWAQGGHYLLKLTLDLMGSRWTLPPQAYFRSNGLKWTRTTDLTLIRRAL